MQIAPLTLTDLAAYRALMLEAFTQAPDAFTSTPEERAAEPDSWWAKRVADPEDGSRVFGAFCAGDLVGIVGVSFSNRTKVRHKAHLFGMYVKPSARRTGAGRRLMEAALAEARSRPERVLVTLTVTQGNEAALRLYESLGFQTYGVEPMAIRTPQGYRSKVLMYAPLRAIEGEGMA